MLIAKLDGVGRDVPLSGEKLSPILAFYSAANLAAGIEICTKLLQYGGLGHTASIHSQNEAAVKQFGLAIPAFRIVVNTSAVHGSIGYSTNLFPAMTLGCGSHGGNITSDNIGPQHLMNIKRVAWESRPVEHRTIPVGRAPLGQFSGGSELKLRHQDTYQGSDFSPCGVDACERRRPRARLSFPTGNDRAHRRTSLRRARHFSRRRAKARQSGAFARPARRCSGGRTRSGSGFRLPSLHQRPQESRLRRQFRFKWRRPPHQSKWPNSCAKTTLARRWRTTKKSSSAQRRSSHLPRATSAMRTTSSSSRTSSPRQRESAGVNSETVR